jgi:ABC-type multidrug transport system fused ATPase/permease subunit
MVFEILGLELKEFLFNFFIPFAIVFLISFGIFERMKIFNRRINLFLALGFTTLFVSTTYFVFFTGFLTQLSSFFVIASFLTLFVVGVSSYVYKKGKEIELKPRLSRLLVERDKLFKEREKAIREGNVNKVRDVEKMIEEVNKEIDAIRKVMG